MESEPKRAGEVVTLTLLLASAAVLCSGCISQPESPCVIAHAGGGLGGVGTPYIAQYYVTATPPSANCLLPQYAYWPTGNFVGEIFAESYGPVTGTNKLVGWLPEEFGWSNGYTGEYIEGGPNSAVQPDGGFPNPVAFGNFTTTLQDTNGTCLVAGTDGGTQNINGINTTYDFTKVLVYTNPAAGEGFQIQANVTITRDDGTGVPCVQSYVAIGLWPSALCNVDNDCNPNPQPNGNPPRPLGSGLLPGTPYVCATDLAGSDPIIVPAPYLEATKANGTPPESCPYVTTLADGGLQASNIPYALLSGPCGGGTKDNNGTNGVNICFYPSPSPTTFPYVTSQ
jgi:hypothetical protein